MSLNMMVNVLQSFLLLIIGKFAISFARMLAIYTESCLC